jgi:hypothetical protein
MLRANQKIMIELAKKEITFKLKDSDSAIFKAIN